MTRGNLVWKRVGGYGMQAGEYRVAKVFVDGCTLYLLSFGNDRLKYCNDFDEAKEAAEAHAKGEGNDL